MSSEYAIGIVLAALLSVMITGDNPRTAAVSGPTSKKLHDQAAAALGRLRKENPDAQGAVPVELA